MVTIFKRTGGEKIFSVFNYSLVGLIALSTVYPFVYTASISFSTMAEAIRDGFHFYPKEVTLLSYKMVLSNESIFPAYMNTILRTMVGTFFTILVTSIFAYPLSRAYMPNAKFFTILVLFTMLFNGGLIPNYLVVRKLGLIDNRMVYILPNLVGAFNVIILKNYFRAIPDSLAESAKMDGAGESKILFSIILPLSKPAIATIALWTAVIHWNSWLDGLLYINDSRKQILQILLQRIVVHNQADLIQQGLINPDVLQFTSETIKSATIIVTILPILLVYPFVQKYFVKGIMLGSVKG